MVSKALGSSCIAHRNIGNLHAVLTLEWDTRVERQTIVRVQGGAMVDKLAMEQKWKFPLSALSAQMIWTGRGKQRPRVSLD